MLKLAATFSWVVVSWILSGGFSMAQTVRLTESLQSLVETSTSDLIGVAGSGDIIASSDGGTSFSVVESGANMRAIASKGTTVIAVGDSGTLFRSTDSGANFTAITAPTILFGLEAIASGTANEWIAVGGNGFDAVIVRSVDDGLNWTNVTPAGLGGLLKGVAYDSTAARWIVVGENDLIEGSVLTSTNGTSWTDISPAAYSPPLNAVVSTFDGRFVAVGDSGSVYLVEAPYTGVTRLYDGKLTENLYAIAATALGEVLAGGADSAQISFVIGDVNPTTVGGVAGAGDIRTIVDPSNGTDPTILAGSLTAGSLGPVIELEGPLDFGDVATNGSKSLNLTIRNIGDAPLSVSGLIVPGDFSGSFSGAIVAGGTQSVVITFTPSMEQAYSGTLTVSGDQVSGTNTIGTNGNGVAPPAFTSSAPSSPTDDLAAGNLFGYLAAATGSAASNLVFSIVSSPAWINLVNNNDGTATVSGTPTVGDSGIATVEIQVTDTETTGTSTQQFAFEVYASELEFYLAGFGLSGIDLDGATDTDLDFVINLLEFAFGSNPDDAQSRPDLRFGLEEISGSDYLYIAFPARIGGTFSGASYEADGIVYTVEGSGDLVLWTDPVVSTSIPVGLPALGADYAWVAFRLDRDTSTGNGFLRIEVTESVLVLP